eukprot:CAMPEP_0114500366 /NCGR_PEP_ID=MMETSP0109-20121206/7924_1 /TAXON_ID=29199 /ORGANISM="Chlorarachnion reptans, Strain CCCM449" /LENGTH=135 /DNA_ID=CAMNT_0001678019 /DNA_START=488 /DNA_END=892 /DNA_ORIENTATION=-
MLVDSLMKKSTVFSIKTQLCVKEIPANLRLLATLLSRAPSEPRKQRRKAEKTRGQRSMPDAAVVAGSPSYRQIPGYSCNNSEKNPEPCPKPPRAAPRRRGHRGQVSEVHSDSSPHGDPGPLAGCEGEGGGAIGKG